MTEASDVGERIEQHRRAITRYVRYLVRNAVEAEDLAQETLLQAHLQQSSLQDPATLESWPYQIASRVCIDRLRRMHTRLRR